MPGHQYCPTLTGRPQATVTYYITDNKYYICENYFTTLSFLTTKNIDMGPPSEFLLWAPLTLGITLIMSLLIKDASLNFATKMLPL